MNKLLKFILATILVLTSILFFNEEKIMNIVHAYGDFSYGARHIGEWNGTWISELYIDGQLAFCLDPNVLTPQNPADYPGYSEDWSGLSWDEQERISTIGTAFSKGLISYVEAQIMIWEGRHFDGHLGARPVFDHTNFEITVGQEERFTDTTGTISNQGYHVSECGAGLECRIEGNDLVVKGIAKADNTSATVSKAGAGGGGWVAVWKKPGFQTIGVVHGNDPYLPATVTGRVKAGEIQLVKRDEYGRIVAEAHTFEVATDENFTNIIATITTDANGFAKTQPLENGTYYVREKDTSWGYECNKQVFKAEITGENILFDSLGANGGFVNHLRNFKINITKKDVDNPEIVLDNSKFEIYDTTDGIREYITTISTGEKGNTGSYTFNEAKYLRTYEICEVQAPSGYDLDTNACKTVTIDVKQGEEAKQVDFENKKNVSEANIELVKKDDEYDEIKLNGAEFTVYDITVENTKTELYKVITGNQYLKIYNPYNPLEPLKNTKIDFYAEEELTTLIASATTNEEGVINITTVKGLEKGKEYYYKLPGQIVTFESYDLNSRIRVIKNKEVVFYSDEALTQEVARYTSDTDGWISVGDVVFTKSVAVKNACEVATVSTATNDITKTPEGTSTKYYYKLDYVGQTQKVKVYEDSTGKSNIVLQTGKKYEICETKAPENYKVDEKNKCRVVSLLEDDIKNNPGLKFETERFENDINKLRLQLYKVDFDNNSILLNDGHFTITDVSWNNKSYQHILPYNKDYQVGQVVKYEDLTFVIYESTGGIFKAVNVNTRERYEIWEHRTVNIDRDNRYIGRQVTGGYIVKDFRNELEYKYDWKNLKVGDTVEGQQVVEVVEKEVYKLADGSVIFKEKLDKQPQENTKFTITNEKFEYVKEVFTGKDGFAVITTIPDGLYYAYNEATGQSEQFSIEKGAFNLPGLRKDRKLYVCEVQAPVGYLIGEVCETIEVSKSDNSVVVKNVKPNKRKRQIRKMGEELFDVNLDRLDIQIN